MFSGESSGGGRIAKVNELMAQVPSERIRFDVWEIAA